MPNTIHLQQRCHLLGLPAEIQLAIYELAVVGDSALLLNCACDSSYPGHKDEWQTDQQAWKCGAKHPPHQPSLTRTCRSIRDLALPIFYRENVFHAHYCFTSAFDLALDWLKAIDAHNRRILRHLYLFDGNPALDGNFPQDFKGASRTLAKMNGRTETVLMEKYCYHRVSFWHLPIVAYDGLEGLFA